MNSNLFDLETNYVCLFVCLFLQSRMTMLKLNRPVMEVRCAEYNHCRVLHTSSVTDTDGQKFMF